MVKHIVFFKLKEQAHGRSKQENAREIKQSLEALNGRIPGLLKLEVGLDFSRAAGSTDIALYSEFVSKKALQEYQEHPLHQALIPYITEARLERSVADYEVGE